MNANMANQSIAENGLAHEGVPVVLISGSRGPNQLVDLSGGIFSEESQEKG
jgi:hypothetical protein